MSATEKERRARERAAVKAAREADKLEARARLLAERERYKKQQQAIRNRWKRSRQTGRELVGGYSREYWRRKRGAKGRFISGSVRGRKGQQGLF